MMHLEENKSAKSLTYHLENDLINLNEISLFLKDKLTDNEIVRVCIHANNEDLSHMMIIAIKKNYEMPLHKNPTKNKIYVIIEGEIKFTIENKVIIAKTNDIVKVDADHFMKQIALSDIAIYQEIIAGPFRGDTVYES